MLSTNEIVILSLIISVLSALLYFVIKKYKSSSTVESDTFIKEMSNNVLSGQLIIAPELKGENDNEPSNNDHLKMTSIILDDCSEQSDIVVSPERMHILENSEATEDNSELLVDRYGLYDPTLDLSSYVSPHVDLLASYKSKVDIAADELEEKKLKLISILNSFKVKIDGIRVIIGPTVTMYEIIPAPGVRISKIISLENDIALSLASAGVRVIGHISGTNMIGIQVPNKVRDIVSTRSVLATEKFQNNTMELPIALGKTMHNEVFIVDLAIIPHLLIAGATGQGKSVALNAILFSLLFKMHPSQLKFVLIDFNKLEFNAYHRIDRHFLAKLPGEPNGIITDASKAVNTLNSLCMEMAQRYDLLKDAQVRNMKDYNDKFIKRELNPNNSHRFLPFIIIVIDEFADLISVNDVEQFITRITQQGRAVGIHLIISTQNPSVNIITATIKSNFPSRIAFKTSSTKDSKAILERGGAESLNGEGDILFSNGNELMNLQGTFVDTTEIERITEFIGNQKGYPDSYQLPDLIDESAHVIMVDLDNLDLDSMFEDAARIIVRHQFGSTSLIQRKLKLSYNRAGRIMDQLESTGIVGPFDGSKSREVFIENDYSLEQYLKKLNHS